MTQRLEKIFVKIEKLISSNNALIGENVSLKSEIDLLQKSKLELENQLNEMKAQKENLENKLKFYTLAPESLNKREIKNKIDQYISEIDLCIKQLENI